MFITSLAKTLHVTPWTIIIFGIFFIFIILIILMSMIQVITGRHNKKYKNINKIILCLGYGAFACLMIQLIRVGIHAACG